MTSVENKKFSSPEEKWNKERETNEQSKLRTIQNVTQKLFSNFFTEEKSNLIISIPSYLKLPGTNFQGVFNMLIKLKNDNPNNPKLAQIIINHIKKLNEKKHLT